MKKLFRSENRIIGGVCGGLAEYLNIDVSLIRILTLFAFIWGLPLLVYLFAWIIIPDSE